MSPMHKKSRRRRVYHQAAGRATRYAALDMFASQTRDLYHIETVRKGGYIEFAVRQIYRAEPSEAYRQIASVDTNAVLVRKRT